MKLRIYVETSVISYLAARPSSDALNMTRQFQSLRGCLRALVAHVPMIATPEEILESTP
jgi:hypothetical protein